MGWLRDVHDKAIDVLLNLFQDKKSVKIIFYSIGAFTLISSIVFMFSMQYTGSNSPGSLFGNENFSYSYAGNPSYVTIFSDWQYIGIRGINNTTASFTVNGPADIELFTGAGIGPTSSYFPREDENGRFIIHTLPGDVATVKILVNREDEFDYNMIFEYNKNGNKAVIPDQGSGTEFKLFKRGKDQYVISGRFNNQAPKIFYVKNDPQYNFPIDISIKKAAKNNGNGMSKDEELNYTGQVRISANDFLLMQIPVSEISETAREPLKSVTLKNSEGSLDVRHNMYPCSHADNINITSVYNASTVKLMNGMIIVSGNAKQLEFRQRYFQTPWSVILKEGNFAIIIGLLSSFFTLFVGKLFMQFKK